MEISYDKPRILGREYKWKKGLAKWNSLPCLRVRPSRALFECARCYFINTLGTTCPWCPGVCRSIVPRRPQRPVSKRISAPSLLSETQKEQLLRIERRPHKQKNSEVIQAHKEVVVKGEQSLSASTSPAIATPGPSRPASARHRTHRNAAIYSASDYVAKATTADTDQPFLRHLAGMYERAERERLQSSDPATSIVPTSAEDTTIDRNEDGSSVSTGPSSTRTLRHKKRMDVLRKQPSSTLRRRFVSPGSRASHRRAEVRVLQPTPMILPLHPDTIGIPLGHPERPLYTAIRKNMAPAPSASASTSPSPTPSFDHISMHGVIADRQSKSLDIPRATTLGRSYRYHLDVPASDWTSGCSLSGEQELRMGLARCRSADSVSFQYTFRETKRGGGVIKEKVKNLGKGLRELLMGRA